MKKNVLLFMLIICLLLFCSCQPTPEKPFVVGKDSEKMIEQATESDGNETNDIKTLEEALNVPETVTFEKDSTKGFLHLDVNAKTYVPDTASLPIYRVSITPFSQEQVDKLVEVLMQGKEIFCFDESQLGNTMTKAQLEKF